MFRSLRLVPVLKSIDGDGEGEIIVQALPVGIGADRRIFEAVFCGYRRAGIQFGS